MLSLVIGLFSASLVLVAGDNFELVDHTKKQTVITCAAQWQQHRQRPHPYFDCTEIHGHYYSCRTCNGTVGRGAVRRVAAIGCSLIHGVVDSPLKAARRSERAVEQTDFKVDGNNDEVDCDWFLRQVDSNGHFVRNGNITCHQFTPSLVAYECKGLANPIRCHGCTRPRVIAEGEQH